MLVGKVVDKRTQGLHFGLIPLLSPTIFSFVALEEKNNFFLVEITSHLDGVIFKSAKLTTLFIQRIVNLFSPKDPNFILQWLHQ